MYSVLCINHLKIRVELDLEYGVFVSISEQFDVKHLQTLPLYTKNILSQSELRVFLLYKPNSRRQNKSSLNIWTYFSRLAYLLDRTTGERHTLSSVWFWAPLNKSRNANLDASSSDWSYAKLRRWQLGSPERYLLLAATVQTHRQKTIPCRYIERRQRCFSNNFISSWTLNPRYILMMSGSCLYSFWIKHARCYLKTGFLDETLYFVTMSYHKLSFKRSPSNC